MAAVLARTSNFFDTDFAAVCLPDGNGRYEVCLDARQASGMNGDARAGMEDLAREVVEMAGSIGGQGCGSECSTVAYQADQPAPRFLSAPLRIPGGRDGLVLFANRSAHVGSVSEMTRAALSAVSQIIAGRIPPGGLSPDRARRPGAGFPKAPTHGDTALPERVQRVEASAEAHYRGAFRVAPAMLLMLDWRGAIIDASDQFLRFFGYGRSELVARFFHEIVPENMRKAADAAADTVSGTFTRTGGIALAIWSRQGKAVDVEAVITRQPSAGVVLFVTDISELDQEHSRIEQRNAELERLNENLQNFASIASHDLQEPLRKIRYFTEMLQRALVEDNHDDIDYALEVLENASRRASRLVSDLLTFSRSSSESLVREPVDLAHMVDGLVEEIRHEEAAHDADIRIDIPPVSVSGDPTAITQLFRNLIGNALKYRASGRTPSVLIRARIDDAGSRHLRISIEDNGIGFEPQYAETILQPFRRLHRRQEFPGSGIGLAICDMVARRHGWKLTAEGRPGEGATFTVDIPEFERPSVS
ncbi:sensor histidine kinase [Breoghania corrubedonensis]|uniref:sensor histidine kinase n=1 Tax=Breoghania corrubedonensis TaxID=665038 RepID=UPI001FE528B7|nr:ATP-binding protein [Breoghania corrubedonensis]